MKMEERKLCKTSEEFSGENFEKTNEVLKQENERLKQESQTLKERVMKMTKLLNVVIGAYLE